MLIGGICGALVVYAVPMFDKLKVDDPVGALSVHLVNGIWGTTAVGIFKPDASMGAQLIGILCVGAFVFGTNFIVCLAMKIIMGLRVSEKKSYGICMPEFRLTAYPESV
jgi:Amt family ammonium transporter